MYFIDYLSKKHNYNKKRQYFDDWGKAIEWGLKNIDNFSIDMLFCTPNKSN
jgi:hypothetical protein